MKQLKARVKAAQTYEEWETAAKEVEHLQHAGKPNWENELFDSELVQHRLQVLQANRLSGDVGEMMFALRADLLRSLGNMTQEQLHHRVTVPSLIRNYIAEVRLQLKLVTDELDLQVDEKLTFLQEMRHAFGRTALMLSGAGMHGAFHLGVIKGLLNHDQLPRVVAGSSVGAIVSAFVATRTPQELNLAFSDEHFHVTGSQLAFFNGQTLSGALAHMARRGAAALYDYGFFKRRIHALLGDLTFQEAYDRSGGRILCVSVCPTTKGEETFLLNHLSAPHCVVWSAIAASCAFPGMFPPQTLLSKNRQGQLSTWKPAGSGGEEETFSWHDGLVQEEAPIKGLRELFNVNYFIVSQTIPYITTILQMKKTVCSSGGLYLKLADAWELEFKHRLKQLTDMAPWMDAFGMARVLQQQWEGDVSVVMPPRLGACLMMERSTPSDLYQVAQQGERSAWAKLAAIETSCSIESQLDECVAQLKQKQRQASLLGRGRIPSWTYMHNHFPSSSDHVSISPRSSCSSLHDICGTVHNYDVPETPADPSPNGTPKCGTAVSAHVSSSNIIRTESMRSLSLAAQSSLCVI